MKKLFYFIIIGFLVSCGMPHGLRAADLVELKKSLDKAKIDYEQSVKAVQDMHEAYDKGLFWGNRSYLESDIYKQDKEKARALSDNMKVYVKAENAYNQATKAQPKL